MLGWELLHHPASGNLKRSYTYIVILHLSSCFSLGANSSMWRHPNSSFPPKQHPTSRCCSSGSNSFMMQLLSAVLRPSHISFKADGAARVATPACCTLTHLLTHTVFPALSLLLCCHARCIHNTLQPSKGADNVYNEHGWGPWDQCDMNKPQDWLKRTRSNCYSCLTGENVCTNPPTMLYHQYLEYLHPKLWEGNMLSVKAFLMTQVGWLGFVKGSRQCCWWCVLVPCVTLQFAVRAVYIGNCRARSRALVVEAFFVALHDRHQKSFAAVWGLIIICCGPYLQEPLKSAF